MYRREMLDLVRVGGSADAGPSILRAMIRFSCTYSLRHCSAHRFCKGGWSISMTSRGSRRYWRRGVLQGI